MAKFKMHQPMTPTPKKSLKNHMVKIFTLKNKFTYKFTNFNFQLEKSS
jgi:hypothetical protein